VGSAALLRRPLADEFLRVAITPSNADQCTKFNFLAALVSEIWRESQNKNWELLISQTPLPDKFLHRAIVLVKAYKHTNFNLLAPIVSEIYKGSQNKKWGLLIFSGALQQTNFTCSYSTFKCLPVY